MTDTETESVRTIFDKNGVKLLELVVNEGWATYGSNQAEFRCFDLDGNNAIDSIHVELVTDKISDDFLEMIFALASNGNLALTSDHRRFVRIVGRPPNSKELARWPDAQNISSVADIEDWLRNQIKGERVWEDDEEGGAVYFSE